MFVLYVAPNVTVLAAPPMVVGDENHVPIILSCTALMMGNVTSSISYQFTWLKDGLPINQPDDRIMVHIIISNISVFVIEAIAM